MPSSECMRDPRTLAPVWALSPNTFLRCPNVVHWQGRRASRCAPRAFPSVAAKRANFSLLLETYLRLRGLTHAAPRRYTIGRVSS